MANSIFTECINRVHNKKFGGRVSDDEVWERFNASDKTGMERIIAEYDRAHDYVAELDAEVDSESKKRFRAYLISHYVDGSVNEFGVHKYDDPELQAAADFSKDFKLRWTTTKPKVASDIKDTKEISDYRGTITLYAVEVAADASFNTLRTAYDNASWRNAEARAKKLKEMAARAEEAKQRKEAEEKAARDAAEAKVREEAANAANAAAVEKLRAAGMTDEAIAAMGFTL